MSRRRRVENLSENDLRWMLVERRRAARQERLERFRRSGRVVMVTPEASPTSLDALHTSPLDDLDEEEEGRGASKRSRPRRILDFFLLAVEVSAVLGFIFVIFNGLSLIRELNREVITALEQPT
ncbi:MAG: hypothetical protein PHS96_14745, partial [Anaerolineales bacterium]|nr:hypothetical protein [Anaerolineales bacterium]